MDTKKKAKITLVAIAVAMSLSSSTCSSAYGQKIERYDEPPQFLEFIRLFQEYENPYDYDIRYSIHNGAIMLPNESETQPFIVAEVLVSSVSSTRKTVPPNDVTFANGVTTFLIPAKQRRAIQLNGFCLIKLGNGPSSTTKYKFSNKRISPKLLDGIRNKPTKEDQQTAMWASVEKMLSGRRL